MNDIKRLSEIKKCINKLYNLTLKSRNINTPRLLNKRHKEKLLIIVNNNIRIGDFDG